MVVHIFGASGSGTTTTGRELCRLTGWKHLDTDDYYHMPTDPPFTTPRPPAERVVLMEKDLTEDCVISGSMCGWGDVFIPRFGLAVYLQTPTPLRIERLKRREESRFGARIQPGGDMYTDHLEFLAWAATYDTGKPPERSRAMHDAWYEQLPCAKMKLDGSLPPEEIMARMFRAMNGEDVV